MVDMIHEHVIRDIYDLSVHSDVQSLSCGPGPLTSDGIRCMGPFRSVPFVFAQPLVVVGIDNCIFALREGDSPEGIAVAELSV